MLNYRKYLVIPTFFINFAHRKQCLTKANNMEPLKIYIVQSQRISDYETLNDTTDVYVHKSNALKKLQDIKNQDFMPIVKEEGFAIVTDDDYHFEAGRRGLSSQDRVSVTITETNVLDYVANVNEGK